MSCCGGNCGCGADCKCGSSCTGCKMYPNLKEETIGAGNSMFLGIALPQMGFEAAAPVGSADSGACNCKNDGHCSCNPCTCK